MTLQIVAAIWAGAILGVSFVATPVKFRARSLAYEVALDVGRVTYRALDFVELALLAAGALLALRLPSAPASLWWAAAAVVACLAVQRGLLMPPMDRRAREVIGTGRRLPPSRLHHVYIATELAKLVALLVIATR